MVRQIVAFASVSVVTTVLDFSLFNLLIASGAVSTVTANTISYGAGIAASYILNKMFTFSGGGRDNRGHEVGLFILLNLFGLGVSNGAVAAAVRGFDGSTLLINIVKLAAGVATWVIKFFTFKFWVYPHRRTVPDAMEDAV